jgi:DNA-binding transcriptional MerR regulator
VDKSPEAFRTISEVADDLDLPQHVLRFWETRFTQIRPLKRGGGRRYYRPDDVELLRGIRHLLYAEGYTIRGVQRILKEQGPKTVQAVARGAPLPPGIGEREGGLSLKGLMPGFMRQQSAGHGLADDEEDEAPQVRPAPPPPRVAPMPPPRVTHGLSPVPDAEPVMVAVAPVPVAPPLVAPPVALVPPTVSPPAVLPPAVSPPTVSPLASPRVASPLPVERLAADPVMRLPRANPVAPPPMETPPEPRIEPRVEARVELPPAPQPTPAPSALAPAEGALPRDDIRKLQAALFDLSEVRRLLDAVRKP